MIYVKSGKLSDSLSYVRLFVIDTAKIEGYNLPNKYIEGFNLLLNFYNIYKHFIFNGKNYRQNKGNR